MTHAFDVNGKEFDAHGEYADWWKPADDRNYEKITRALVSLFKSSKYMGHTVNGKKTLSENIADLGGLAISLGGLEREIKRQGVDDMGRLEGLRNFFIAYAASWREKERRAKGLQALLTDVHAPAQMRVNLIVPHFQEWYDAFNIEPNHKLYITPKKRIRIF
jgi:predicted metalloendopeptidase